MISINIREISNLLPYGYKKSITNICVFDSGTPKFIRNRVENVHCVLKQLMSTRLCQLPYKVLMGQATSLEKGMNSHLFSQALIYYAYIEILCIISCCKMRVGGLEYHFY
jgi:hypothetical protein